MEGVKTWFYCSFYRMLTLHTPHYENVPFEVPEGWVSVPVSELFCLNPKYEITDDTNVGFIPMACVDDGFSGNHQFEKRIWKEVKKGYCHFQNGDIGIAKISPCFENLKSTIFQNLPNNYGAGTTELVILHPLNIHAKFYLYLFKSQWYISEGTKYFKGVVGQQRVHKGIFTDLQIPLPPLAEQYRIVAEIEKWFVLIDQIEQEKANLQATIKQTKSKILELAIHGKLVPQDPNDEPASELLKRINPDFTPCDNAHSEKLPEGWCICKLENIAKILDNLRKPISSNERNLRIANKPKEDLYPYYGATGLVGMIDDYILNGKFLLLGEDGAPFLDRDANKAYVITGKCWVNNHAHILLPQCDFDYLMYYLNQIDFSNYVNGSTRLKLTQADMRSILVVLPPFAEQQRIVKKIEEQFFYLNIIQKALET